MRRKKIIQFEYGRARIQCDFELEKKTENEFSIDENKIDSGSADDGINQMSVRNQHNQHGIHPMENFFSIIQEIICLPRI